MGSGEKEKGNCLSLSVIPKLADNAEVDIPLYTQIHDIFFELLQNGTARPGMTIPGENALALHFEVSRGTIRQALRVLEDNGMILKHQGSGSVVGSLLDNQQTGLQPYVDICRGFCTEEPDRVSVNINYTGAGVWMSKELEVEKGSLLLEAKMTFYCGELACAYSERYVPVRYLEVFHVDSGSRRALNTFLTDQIQRSVARTKSEMTATLNHASELGAEADLPCLLVTEVTYDALNRPLSFNKNYLRGDCYRIASVKRHRISESV